MEYVTFDRVLGLISFILTIVIYRRQTKAQNKFEEFSTQTYKTLREQGALVQHHLVSLRTDLLLLFFEQSENKTGFWHFKLRFEYWDELGIYIKSNEKAQHIDIKILGQTIEHTEEGKSLERNAYICEVLNCSDKTILNVSPGDKIVCFARGENKCVSKYYHPVIEPDEYFEFGISRLGSVMVGSSPDRPAGEVKIYPRVKDALIK